MDMGECSICGFEAEYAIVEQHFNNTHMEEQILEEGDRGDAEDLSEDSALNEEDRTELGTKWSTFNVKLLLHLYDENQQLFKSSKKTNKSIWLLISKKMNKKGNNFTGDQCDLKFRNLKKTYKRIKDSNGKTGRGAISWPYFSIFEGIFGGDGDVHPPCLASNMSGITYYKVTGAAGAGPSSLSSLSSTTVEGASSSTEEIEQPTGKASHKRPANRNEEPEWVKQVRIDAGERHKEKMALLNQLVDMLKKK